MMLYVMATIEAIKRATCERTMWKLSDARKRINDVRWPMKSI